VRLANSFKVVKLLPCISAAFFAALMCGGIGCGPSQADLQQQIEQAKAAQARAAAAEEAAHKAQIAAEEATAAADKAQKSVHEAAIEIDRVGKHIDQMQQDDQDQK
jgi:K+-transporting ATPase c subunit